MSKIYQIFYNEETKESCDKGFLLLDNIENLRPDWREYWPIRNYLMNNSLNEDTFYGFFSWKFKAKTGLSSDECFKFIKSQSLDTDVISFSPFFDLGAFFQNSFFQAIAQEPNSKLTMDGALEILTTKNINQIIMHSGNNIFGNFFVAKSRFWMAWLENCELIWNECEANITPLSKGLNAFAEHHDSPAAIKTFVIERVASLMLATNPSWAVKSYNPFKLPFSNAGISKQKGALIQMDALKIAYSNQKRAEYLNLYYQISELVLNNLNND
jgi:hypothetical protein